MKKYSAIQEMYYGQRGDGQLIPTNEEYHEHSVKQAEIIEKLEGKLKDDKEGLELLEQLFFEGAGMESAAVAQHYREGFAFGVLIGIEIAEMR